MPRFPLRPMEADVGYAMDSFISLTTCVNRTKSTFRER
jgi:hypothetical protein